MSRKIALLLIMFILCNMVVGASDSPNITASDDPNTEGIVWLVVGITAIIVSVILVVTVVEADVPDDGIRLTSMQNVLLEQKGSFGSFLSILQHINVDYTPENNKTFVRFSYKY